MVELGLNMEYKRMESKNKKKIINEVTRILLPDMSQTRVYNYNQVIRVLKPNPYRLGSDKYKQFALLKDGMTVRDYIIAGGKKSRLAPMEKYGRIKVI